MNSPGARRSPARRLARERAKRRMSSRHSRGGSQPQQQPGNGYVIGVHRQVRSGRGARAAHSSPTAVGPPPPRTARATQHEITWGAPLTCEAPRTPPSASSFGRLGRRPGFARPSALPSAPAVVLPVVLTSGMSPCQGVVFCLTCVPPAVAQTHAVCGIYIYVIRQLFKKQGNPNKSQLCNYEIGRPAHRGFTLRSGGGVVLGL